MNRHREGASREFSGCLSPVLCKLSRATANLGLCAFFRSAQVLLFSAQKRFCATMGTLLLARHREGASREFSACLSPVLWKLSRATANLGLCAFFPSEHVLVFSAQKRFCEAMSTGTEKVLAGNSLPAFPQCSGSSPGKHSIWGSVLSFVLNKC